ncbi:MAG: hypothetical protein AAFN93_24330, partial [Bacteroidota bacterium]
MEFEEMRKIWDTQNNRPLYAINEEALHRSIKSKKNKASRVSNINEIALVAIAVITAIPLLIKNISTDNLYAFPPVIVLLLTGVYVLVGRVKRKKMEKTFDQNIIGDLDQAIANMNFEISRAKTFIWWYILPLLVPSFLNMYMNNAGILKWLLVIG